MNRVASARHGIDVAALARMRADYGLTDEGCMAWFGVGLATIERIEAGEIEPGDELATRIDYFIAVSDQPTFAHSAGAWR